MLRGRELVLGPFEGKPACVHIRLDEGVCGAAASSRKRSASPTCTRSRATSSAIPDSRSEIVVPLVAHGDLLGVLDIDSPTTGRFSEADQVGVENSAESFCALQEKRKYVI